MQNILFVSPADFSDPYVPNGGTYVSRLHLDTLGSLPNVNLTVLSLSRVTSGEQKGILYIPATKNKLDTLFKNCMGYAAYLTPKAEHIVLDYIRNGNFDILFLDTSNFGRIAKKVKKAKPNLRIITFFHNVEYVYALSIVHIVGVYYVPTFFASWYNEKLAVAYSDTLIAINERDKNSIEKKYNAHISQLLSPYFLEHELPEDYKNSALSKPLEVLFLGSWFHANIAGITWFIENVLPVSNIRLTVAGKGMEALQNRYALSDQLRIIGTIEHTEPLYVQSDCVVNPVFDGSGMKIKTGEALSYGKTIVGTPEAFMGYDITNGIEGYICETAEEFVKAFQEIALKQQNKINPASYHYFKQNLSKQAAIQKMSSILVLDSI